MKNYGELTLSHNGEQIIYRLEKPAQIELVQQHGKTFLKVFAQQLTASGTLPSLFISYRSIEIVLTNYPIDISELSELDGKEIYVEKGLGYVPIAFTSIRMGRPINKSKIKFSVKKEGISIDWTGYCEDYNSKDEPFHLQMIAHQEDLIITPLCIFDDWEKTKRPEHLLMNQKVVLPVREELLEYHPEQYGEIALTPISDSEFVLKIWLKDLWAINKPYLMDISEKGELILSNYFIEIGDLEALDGVTYIINEEAEYEQQSVFINDNEYIIFDSEVKFKQLLKDHFQIEWSGSIALYEDDFYDYGQAFNFEAVVVKKDRIKTSICDSETLRMENKMRLQKKSINENSRVNNHQNDGTSGCAKIMMVFILILILVFSNLEHI